MSVPKARGMEFTDSLGTSVTDVLVPAVMRFADAQPGMRVLDVGCGGGYWAGRFAALGCDVVGIDPGSSGIEAARAAFPAVRFEQAEASRDMITELAEDPFDIVVSTEVVEHLYDPPGWATGCWNALKPGGRLVASTPYHGWLKNVAIALAGKTDFHHDALRVGGHIKFFSNATLTRLLNDAGFATVEFTGVGRLPLLWFSSVLCAKREL
jgi:2-polyprenyl-3-methyl-5-hydroxy-6-metoxy-1,4-benzoquinol methylase